jgi:hypothetical protein
MQDVTIETKILGYTFLYGPMFLTGMGLMVLASILNGIKILWINILGVITSFISTPRNWFIGLVLYYIWRNRS